MTQEQGISVLLSGLRARVTGASVDYVGSVTIHEELCSALGLSERQSVQIRNQETGVELWTYVIMGRSSDDVPPGTICLNGAAAHLVKVDDIVYISAYGVVPAAAHSTIDARSWDAVEDGFTDVVTKMGKPDAKWASNAVIEYASGKVHRPRLTTVVEDSKVAPTLFLDADWANEAGICNGETGHIVNVTNGQRDIMTVKHSPSGSKSCTIQMGKPSANKVEGYGNRRGYKEGDVIIAMSYVSLTMDSIRKGEAPPMKISFPFEKPKDAASTTDLNETWDMTNQIVWSEKRLASGLIKILGLKPGMKVLDCSCGAGFPGIELARAGIDIKMSDASAQMVELAKKRAEQMLGDDKAKELDIRCSACNDLSKTWGEDEFDVIIWRGNAMPYVFGYNSTQTKNNGYAMLVESAKGVYQTLKPGGVLYADCIPASAGKGTSNRKRKWTKPDGTRVHFDWTLTVDDKKGLLKWKSVAGVGEGDKAVVYKAEITGLLVRELELKSVMTYAGFGLMDKVECSGEFFYEGFRIHKQDGANNYYDRQIDRYRRLWNSNGKMCYGLCQGLWPTIGEKASTKGVENGVMAGPNMALQEYMASKYGGMEIKSLLDIGCGTGRSSIDLAKQFPNAKITGLDPASKNIERAKDMAKEEKITNAQFFQGTAEEIQKNKIGTFNAAWSECALCHATPESRRKALKAISDHLEDGGFFILSDVIAGNASASPASHLHIWGRLGMQTLWNRLEYTDILESNNLAVMEYVNLSAHQSKCYLDLASEADKIAKKSEKGTESHQEYSMLSKDYKLSAAAIDKDELGWGLFVCRKAPKKTVETAAVDSTINRRWRASARPKPANGYKH